MRDICALRRDRTGEVDAERRTGIPVVAVDEVATVYAGLLELSATANTLGVTVDDSEVSAVNDSVTLLQMTFAELEADAAALPADGLL